MNIQIGKHVKEFRKKNAMTLNDLSEKTGLSVSYLSMLERGLNSPTIENLNIICQALNITLTSLIEKINTNVSIVTRPAERKTIFQDAGVTYLAATEGDFQMSSVVMTVTDNALHVSHGHVADEVGYIISGSLKMTISGTDYSLNAGDCIYIESNRPHSYKKSSAGDCVTFWTYSDSNRSIIDSKSFAIKKNSK